MMRFCLIFFAIMWSLVVKSDSTQIIDGKIYKCEDGVCTMEDVMQEETAPAADETAAQANSTPQSSAKEHSNKIAPSFRRSRLAMGYMSPAEFIAFLDDTAPAQSELFAGKSIWIIVLLILAGGFCLNLTPCVLPMIPVTLIVIGKSFRRAVHYSLGIILAYGSLGLLSGFGGMAFGALQSNFWFNLVMSAVFLVLSLSSFGVFRIDLTRYRKLSVRMPFVMGVVSSLLAGSCVAPVVIAVLALTADWVAAGRYGAFAFPFLLALGMASPWPFLGLGMNLLPKPGAWMKKVNFVSGLVILLFAVYYAYLAIVPAINRGKSGQGADFAKSAAIPDGKPILYDCYASWCKNCSAMEKTTLKDELVVEKLKKFTVIKVQAEDINELRKKPPFEKVTGLPAYVIVE